MAAADLEFDAVGGNTTSGKSRPLELTMLTAHDIYLFREGTHGRLYQGMGCHLVGNGGEGIDDPASKMRRSAKCGAVWAQKDYILLSPQNKDDTSMFREIF